MTSLTRDMPERPGHAPGKIRHFGVLIPSTNTTVETEYTRLLPPEWQPHYARVQIGQHRQDAVLAAARRGCRIPVENARHRQGRDRHADPDLGEPVLRGLRRQGDAADAGRRRAGLHLGDGDRRGDATRSARSAIALVSPYSETVIASAKRYYEGRYGLSVVALEGFAATNSYMIGNLGPENGARRLRPHRPSRDRGVCRARRQFPDDGIDRRRGRGNSASRSSRPIRPRYGAC